MSSEREQLIELARKIAEAEGTEEETRACMRELRSRVPHPGVSDLIFYGEKDYSREEIVDIALAYGPVQPGPFDEVGVGAVGFVGATVDPERPA
jgi:hypothetical protein